MSDLRKKLIRLAHSKPELRASLLPLLARQAKEFGSKEELAKYLKDHPKADPKNHSVGKGKGDGKGEKPKAVALAPRLEARRTKETKGFLSDMRRGSGINGLYTALGDDMGRSEATAFFKTIPTLKGFLSGGTLPKMDSRADLDALEKKAGPEVEVLRKKLKEVVKDPNVLTHLEDKLTNWTSAFSSWDKSWAEYNKPRT